MPIFGHLHVCFVLGVFEVAHDHIQLVVRVLTVLRGVPVLWLQILKKLLLEMLVLAVLVL